MARDREETTFPSIFDDALSVGPHEGNQAYFGRDVVQGLICGIDDFVYRRQSRWARRQGQAVLLGTAMWMDDPALLDKLGELAGACVVVTKQARKRTFDKLAPLRDLNERTPGVPMRAFAGLSEMEPKVGGKPAVVGPGDRMGDGYLSSVRSLGYRRASDKLVPILHAKLALLGHVWRYEDWIGEGMSFTPCRLWISSANFTERSRESLEFGFWTEDADLVRGASRFLVKVLGYSEPLESDADTPDPELAQVEYDDYAMAEASLARE